MDVVTTPEIIIRKTKPSRLPVTTLGITFPFQPSLQDDRFIRSTLDYITKAVETKLNEKYNIEFGKRILARLEKAFSRLNYNTHKKSVAILIGLNEESITYLDFFTKPFLYFNKNMSLFDLVATTNNQPEFFLLFSGDTKSMIFEYYHGKLHKEYETRDHVFISNTPGIGRLVGNSTKVARCRQILKVLKLRNPTNNKPVFVTGKTEQINQLYNILSFQEILFKKAITFSTDAEDKLKFLASEINEEWRYWHCEFLAGKIELSKKSNLLVSKINPVSDALKCSKDGLLLIDKYYKKQLVKSIRGKALFKFSEKWMKLLENFLSRGNQIEIVKSGLLKDYGGIVLIENEVMNSLDRRLLNGHINLRKNNFIIF